MLITGNKDLFLRQLYETLEEGQKLLRGDDSEEWPFDKDRYAIKAFTDNIVIGWPVPVRANAESELGFMFSMLALFQMRMV